MSIDAAAASDSDHPEDVLKSPDDTTQARGDPACPTDVQLAPITIDPVLSLELRLRWLEALLLGVRQESRDRKAPREKPPDLKLKPGESLIRLAADVQRRLDAVVESNDGLKKFMHQYDQHADLLTPAFVLSGGSIQGSAPAAAAAAPTYGHMSSDELEALLAEMEPDIRAADRDMREIELLEQKGVLSAGKLADYEALQPRLQALLAAQEQDMRSAASLEKRIATLVERHTTHVDALSELFVAWDDILNDAESKIKVLEREKEAQLRLGYK